MIWDPPYEITGVWYGVPVCENETLSDEEVTLHELVGCWYCERYHRLGRHHEGEDYEKNTPIWHPLTPEKPEGGGSL